ncbi:MAG: GxxExxY protein [Saprospiraceae bacterium]
MEILENQISHIVMQASIKVHKHLGPGLFESVYQSCLAYELEKAGLSVQVEFPLPIKYEELFLKDAFKVDILVNDIVILELKAVSELQQIHYTQLTTYLKLSNRKLGLLINFGGLRLMDGFKRVVNDLVEE